MRRPDVGRFWNALSKWLEAESEVEFPAAAFCQVKSFPDGILQIGFRDGNLQAYCFNCCPIPGGVLGFVGFAFGIHGVRFYFCCLGFSCAFGENATKQVRFVHGVNTP